MVINLQHIVCPLCNDPVSKLLYRYHYENEQVILSRIRKEFPEWTFGDGLCSRCLDYLHSEILLEERIIPTMGSYKPIKTPDDFMVIPTPLRLDADPRFTGKGVTICFIDNGFYPHPDLTALKNRIKINLDITSGEEPAFIKAESHGTMTSVVAAGDGYLSKGVYKGIASEAELVLLKVQDDKGTITAAYLANALEWILANHEKYDIRIVNISLGIENTTAEEEAHILALIEKITALQIIIVAAAGNSRATKLSIPASSPFVLTVGGLDDENMLGAPVDKLYHSNFGKTRSDSFKPELIAHAVWIAAPILPGSLESEKARELFGLLNNNTALSLREETITDAAATGNKLYREKLTEQAKEQCQAYKFISAHYMHVDGTSFAAPIVSSVIAQLLELDPSLSPVRIKEILFSTAARIPLAAPERQGFGVIHPRKATLRLLSRKQSERKSNSPYIDFPNQTIDFYVQHNCATQISVAGTFNNWAADLLFMEPHAGGEWKIQIPLQKPGKYTYKFLVDGKYWIEDYENPCREPDGYSGFNSILTIN